MNVNPELRDKILAMAVTIDGKPVVREPANLAEKISEKEFMAEVTKLAKQNGWKVYHTYNSRKSEAGFPDLVLLRDRIVVAELKTSDGRLTAAQENWLQAFSDAGVERYVWRPDYWPEIVRVLSLNQRPA